MSRPHNAPHPLAGKTILIVRGAHSGSWVQIEDWWDRLVGKSRMHCDGNPACLMYAMQSLDDPLDDEVIYGKMDGLGVLVHVTNLGGVEA